MAVRDRRGEIVNKATLARLFGATTYEVDQWLVMGCPVVKRGSTKGMPWEFDTAAVARWQRSGAVPSPGASDEPDLEKERARLAKEQADQVALKNAVARQQLLPAADVLAGLESAIASARAELLGLPRSCAEECAALDEPRAIEELLSDRVRDALQKLADVRFEADEEFDGDGIDDGDEGMGAAAAPEAERMG